MTTSATHSSDIGVIGGNTLRFVMSKLASKHGKRLFYLTSLYFQVVDIERLKSEAVSKLNNIMELAMRDDALKFPKAFRKVLWKDINISDTLSEELLNKDIDEDDAQRIAERVVFITPKWICYSDTKTMVADVYKLIVNGSQLAKAA